MILKTSSTLALLAKQDPLQWTTVKTVLDRVKDEVNGEKTNQGTALKAYSETQTSMKRSSEREDCDPEPSLRVQLSSLFHSLFRDPLEARGQTCQLFQTKCDYCACAHSHNARGIINMATSSSELNLVKKPNTVWNYFGVNADETGVPVHAELNKPICRLCKKTVPAKRSNTTNLFPHLEDHHSSVFSEIVPTASRVPKRKQATLVEVVEKAKKYCIAGNFRGTKLLRFW